MERPPFDNMSIRELLVFVATRLDTEQSRNDRQDKTLYGSDGGMGIETKTKILWWGNGVAWAIFLGLLVKALTGHV